MESSDQMATMVASVQALTSAMATGEQRMRRLERRSRWLGGGLAVGVALAVFLGFEPGIKAQAMGVQLQNVKDFETQLMVLMGKTKDFIEHLDHLAVRAEQVMTTPGPDGQDGFGALGTLMYRIKQDSDVVRKMAMNKKPTDLVSDKELNNPMNSPMVPLSKMLGRVDAVVSQVSQGKDVFDDLGTLLMRVKQDSDVMRKLMMKARPWDPVPEVELNKINYSPVNAVPDALRSITGELNLVNSSLRVITYSVGSTAGKMGNWMSWMP